LYRKIVFKTIKTENMLWKINFKGVLKEISEIKVSQSRRKNIIISIIWFVLFLIITFLMFYYI
jgi:hypothetical protein